MFSNSELETRNTATLPIECDDRLHTFLDIQKHKIFIHISHALFRRKLLRVFYQNEGVGTGNPLKGEAEEILSDEERFQDSCVPGVDNHHPNWNQLEAAGKKPAKSELDRIPHVFEHNESRCRPLRRG